METFLLQTEEESERNERKEMMRRRRRSFPLKRRAYLLIYINFSYLIFLI